VVWDAAGARDEPHSAVDADGIGVVLGPVDDVDEPGRDEVEPCEQRAQLAAAAVRGWGGAVAVLGAAGAGTLASSGSSWSSLPWLMASALPGARAAR